MPIEINENEKLIPCNLVLFNYTKPIYEFLKEIFSNRVNELLKRHSYLIINKYLIEKYDDKNINLFIIVRINKTKELNTYHVREIGKYTQENLGLNIHLAVRNILKFFIDIIVNDKVKELERKNKYKWYF